MDNSSKGATTSPAPRKEGAGEVTKLTVEEMNRIDVATFKAAHKLPLVMILDNVRSLHNVGSVLRTADAFRLEGVWLCGITGAPDGRPSVLPGDGRPNPNLAEIHKTALGAEDSVDWHYVPTTREAVDHLRAEGYTIVSIEQCKGSVMLNQWEAFPKSSCKYAFVMGNEVKGVSQDIVDVSDLVIEIPQYGTKHSLNVSVTAGIVMWEVLRQALAAGELINNSTL